MKINTNLVIDESELHEQFVHASGPGGQHVNKAATAVRLRFDARHSDSLPEPVRERLLTMRSPQITADGHIVIAADRFRSQARNREDARQRLAALIARAAHPPRKRRKTRVPKNSKKRRLESKKHQARTKRLRRTPPRD